MTLSQRHYKAHIMERFMTSDEIQSFNESYQAHKIVIIGQTVIKKNKRIESGLKRGGIIS